MDPLDNGRKEAGPSYLDQVAEVVYERQVPCVLCGDLVFAGKLEAVLEQCAELVVVQAVPFSPARPPDGVTLVSSCSHINASTYRLNEVLSQQHLELSKACDPG